MSTRWLSAFLEAGGDAPVVTLPLHAKTAKIAKTISYESVSPIFGYSGNFGTSPKKRNITTKADHCPIEWDAADWQEFYNERAGVAEHDGRQPLEKAERMAYESCITRWLDTHPPVHTNDAICPHCQQPNSAPGTSCVPTLSGDGGHVWLHRACLDPWRVRRRQKAIKVLAGIGIIR